MERVLVPGATDFIGYEVAKQLSERGIRPCLLVRRPFRGIILKSLDSELVQGDLSEPQSLKRAVAGIDTIIHLGAVAAFVSYRLVCPSIVDGSRNLLGATREAGVKQFVYGGTLLVYGSQEQPIDQKTPSSPALGYGRAKLEAEQMMAAMAEESGMRFASLRLPHIYGARSLFFEEARKGRILFPGHGDNHYAHLNVADAARALMRAAENGVSGLLVVADNLPCTWNQLFYATQTYYPQLKITHMPKPLALLGTGLMDLVHMTVSSPNLYSVGAVRSWNLNLPVENWLEVIFNPSFPYRFAHMVTAAYLTTAFVVAGIGAYYLWRKRHVQHARVMFGMAMIMAVFVAPMQLVLGYTAYCYYLFRGRSSHETVY